MADHPLHRFVSHEVRHDRRLVIVHLSAEANFQHMAVHFRDLIRSHPELGGYDYICDLTEFRGDAFVEDVKAISEEYAPYATVEPTYTCFATRDPHFGLWAKSMDYLFQARKHFVFLSVEECVQFLDQERRHA